jgi:SAM-dependent methyltransferase
MVFLFRAVRDKDGRQIPNDISALELSRERMNGLDKLQTLTLKSIWDKELPPLTADPRILEIGAGSGWSRNALGVYSGNTLHTDSNPQILAYLKSKHPGAAVDILNISNYPRKDLIGRFDVIICHNTMDLFDPLENPILHASLLLKPESKIILTRDCEGSNAALFGKIIDSGHCPFLSFKDSSVEYGKIAVYTKEQFDAASTEWGFNAQLIYQQVLDNFALIMHEIMRDPMLAFHAQKMVESLGEPTEVMNINSANTGLLSDTLRKCGFQTDSYTASSDYTVARTSLSDQNPDFAEHFTRYESGPDAADNSMFIIRTAQTGPMPVKCTCSVVIGRKIPISKS